MKSAFAILPIRARWPSLLLGLGLLVLTLVAGLALLMLSGWFITASAMAGLGLIGMINIFTPGAGIRMAAITRTLTRYAERLATHAATLQLLTSLRMDVFARLIRRPELELERLQRGDTLSRLTADIDTLDHVYLGVFQPASGALLLTLLAIMLTALWSPALAFQLLLPLLVIYLLIVAGCHSAGTPVSREQARAYPELRQKIVDGLEARLELRALGQHEQFADEVNAQSTRIIQRGQRLAALDAIGGAAILLMGLMTIIATLWLGLGHVMQGALSGAILAAIVLGLFAVSEAWIALPAAWRRLNQSKVAAERVQDLLSGPAIPGPEAQRLAWPNNPAISIQAMSFSWAPHQPRLFNDFDLELAAGQRLAVVGPSGCGKTTLLRLIMGQVQPQQGRVCIGNLDVHSISTEASQRKIAFLSQNPTFFRDSVAGNLRLARAEASDAMLINALESACLGEWLAALPNGLDTWLDEAAANLSGGEQRRLAIARLFLLDPEIVLLDEPAASLDSPTLIQLNRSLDAWLGTRTTLLITHREDTLPPVDHLLRLG